MRKNAVGIFEKQNWRGKAVKAAFINADHDFSTRISDDERSLGSCNAYGKREHT